VNRRECLIHELAANRPSSHTMILRGFHASWLGVPRGARKGSYSITAWVAQTGTTSTQAPGASAQAVNER